MPWRAASAIFASVSQHGVVLRTMLSLVTVALVIHWPSTSQPFAWKPARKTMIDPLPPAAPQ
jgi:hypothetical protein